MSDKLTLGIGLAQELEHSFNRNRYKSLEEIKRLTKGDYLGQARMISLGFAEIKFIERTVDCNVDATTPKDSRWTVKEHCKNGIFKLERRGNDIFANGKKIVLWLSEEQKQRCKPFITGRVLHSQLVRRPVLNANVLDCFLKNQYLVPRVCKNKETCFWGTIYLDNNGKLYVRTLLGSDDGWCGNFREFDDDWFDFNPSAELAD
jgi:hypothetical protein